MTVAAPLSGEATNELVRGKLVNFDTPVGTQIPIEYGEDGSLSGKAGMLAFHLGAQVDRGRWWVSASTGKLCHKWNVWFDAATNCLELTLVGGRIHWRRDDGKTGTATVIAPLESQRAQAPATATARQALGGPASEALSASATSQPAEAPSRAPAAAAPRPPAPHTLPSVPVAYAATARRPGPDIANTSPPPQRQQSAAPAIRLPGESAKSAEPAQAAKAVALAAAPPPAPAPAASAVGGISYRVVNVRPDDVLNLRQAPGTSGAIVATIPPNGRGIRLTGGCAGEWCPVTFETQRGWVNHLYLSPDLGSVPTAAPARR
jgi:hypothetical protein